MKVFVYEAICSGGIFELAGGEQSFVIQKFAGLLAEAHRMLADVCEDLARFPAVTEVCTLWDSRLDRHKPRPVVDSLISVASPEEAELAVREQASRCDFTLLIAPETGGELLSIAKSAVAAGGRLLGPSLKTIEIGGDKPRFLDACRSLGLAVPEGMRLESGRSPAESVVGLGLQPNEPVIVRPVDGVGCDAVRLFRQSLELSVSNTFARDVLVERYVAGVPASVAFLRFATGEILPLHPCLQSIEFDDQGFATYRGGTVMNKREHSGWIERCQRLATEVAQVIDDGNGYHGIDLVLGESSDGSDDVIVELNPRLTTSYTGLRQATDSNLAEWMLASCEASGRKPTNGIHWKEGVEFAV
ncbi:MAG: ATP-grasp domain-containing protein [Planctomycetota bacterium]